MKRYIIFFTVIFFFGVLAGTWTATGNTSVLANHGMQHPKPPPKPPSPHGVKKPPKPKAPKKPKPAPKPQKPKGPTKPPAPPHP